MKENNDYRARLTALKEEQARLERKHAELLAKRRAEIGKLAERLGVLEADDDALAGVLLELQEALAKTGDERLARWRAAGAAFRRKDKDRQGCCAASRAMAWRNLMRMQRVADAERRRDTRRKIQLGGLVIKAGLEGEEPAVILGLLAAAKRVLSGKHAADARQRWKDLGDQAFTQD